MRVCYHIQSHTLPAQLARLIRTIRISSPTSLIVVSHAETGPEIDLGELASDPAVIVLPVPNGYGDFSHVDRWLEAVDLLVRRDVDFDWICNMTGQDYPVVSLAEAERELAESGVDGFIQHFPVFTGEGRWPRSKGVTRYCFGYVRSARPSARARRLMRPLAAINRIQPLVRFSPAFAAVGIRRRAPLPLEDWYGGSFFCSLSRACALYVRDYAAANPVTVRYFRRVLAPDEVFLQTVLVGRGGSDWPTTASATSTSAAAWAITRRCCGSPICPG